MNSNLETSNCVDCEANVHHNEIIALGVCQGHKNKSLTVYICEYHYNERNKTRDFDFAQSRRKRG